MDKKCLQPLLDELKAMGDEKSSGDPKASLRRNILLPATFEPRLDILPESQRLLWPELDAVPSEFVLYGGTGLALQLGHRASEDFDFFSSSSFDPDRLRSRLPFFRDLNPPDPDVWVHCKRDNLEAFVNCGGGVVKVAFFGGLGAAQHVQ